MNVYAVATVVEVEYFTDKSDALNYRRDLIRHTYFQVSFYGDTTEHVGLEHVHVHNS